jgi:hypothetical protein
MPDFFRFLRAELIKLKHSGMFWLSTVGTVFTNLMMAIIPFNFPIVSEYLEMDPLGSWEGWITFHYLGILPMLLPMYLVILCALATLMENRSDSWKLLHALPSPKALVYLSKLKVVGLVFAFSHLLFLILLVIIPFLTGTSFTNTGIPALLLLKLAFGTIVSCMGILSLVYLVSYFTRSLVLPLAVGILGFVLAQLIEDYSLGGSYFPFSWPSLTIDSIFQNEMALSTLLVSVLFLCVVTFIGVILANRDRAKSY